MSNSRQVAFDALIKMEKQGGFSNLTLDSCLSKTTLDARDRSFVSNLFYGVIERRITLDYQLSLYLSKPLKKLKPEVLVIMRMGVYQILFMDKVPDSAAVNESVKLSRKNGASFASSLINAVLRKVSVNGLMLPDENDKINFMSVKYSCPVWIIKKWIKEYSEEDAFEFVKASIGEPPVYIRVNNVKTTCEKLKESFLQNGIECKDTYNENTLEVLFSGRDIEKTEEYQKGFFHVQDMASQLCAKFLDAKSGHRVFDLCSAPGGKAYTVAEIMQNDGEVLCFDIYENRVNLIKKGAERLELNIIKARTGDAAVFNNDLGFADRVLCDVPCSGLGIIRRKPEIKYKKEEEFSDLPKIQKSILQNAARYVKKGGKLLYSTCTLSKAENEDVVKWFLNNNPEFKICPLDINGEVCEYTTLSPHKNKSDGFFIAVLEHISDKVME